MAPRTWLDAMVYRFQHRWETNPQFRAAATGAIGLIVVIAMCSCMGVTGVVANNVLASVGAGSGGGGGGYNLDTGTGKLAAPTAFPTYTLAPYSPGVPPAVSPIPNSQTPQPSPTLPPTATALPTSTSCQPNCGGGGGGGGHGTVSGSASPTPWIPGQTGYVSVHTSKPNIGIAIILQYANGVTETYEPAGQTDGNGDFTFSEQVQNNPGTAKITIMANFNPIAYADVYQQVQ